MAISEISNQGALPGSVREKKLKEAARPRTDRGDSVELSTEAKSLFEAGEQKRMEEIQQKIRDKFYFRQDVTEKVVDGILRDLTK